MATSFTAAQLNAIRQQYLGNGNSDLQGLYIYMAKEASTQGARC